MKLTAQQRAAIEHRGSNLLVSASAGAGKTEVLARRCVALIADPDQPCGIDRLLVVTFTRAAAAELRVRVARMLREQAAQTRQEELRRHLRRQELLVDAADIGTIDSWCGRIVREHFAQLGIDVEFTVLGEQDAKLLRAAVVDELFDQIHRGGDPLLDEARDWIARAAAPSDSFLRELVARLSAFREHLVNPDAWFERQAQMCASDDAEQVLADALAAECHFQHEQLTNLLATLDEPARELLQPYSDELARWQQELATPSRITSIVVAIGGFKIPGPGRRTQASQETPAVTEVRKRWLAERLQNPWKPEEVQSILAHTPGTGQLTALLLRLENRYQQMLSAAKRQRAALEFGDVLRLALDLLGRPTAGRQREATDVARLLQERYEHILVDEYQDTSPVQVELLRLVTRTGPGCANRFMVGDVKQSIYGFRQAEPRLFVELSDLFESGGAEGRVAYLTDNFRSHADLLAPLNEFFARLFDRTLGGTPYGARERLTPGRAAGEIANPTLADRPRVAIHVIEHDARRGRDHVNDDAEQLGVELIEREAQLAANEIHALLADGVQVPARGPAGRITLRSLRLADIVILLRSAKQNAGLVARVLRANRIPCATSGRESLLDAIEVRDVYNALALLINRRQDVPLAAYLRSPLVGLSAGELLQIRKVSDQPGLDLCEAIEHFRRVRPTESLAVKLDAAMAQLDTWAEAAREEELPAVLRRVFQDSGLLLYVQALRGGEQRVALLRCLQNLAGEFSASGQGGVAEFVEYLEALAAEDVDPGALAAGGEDVVRIMTIHGAKGLEFPVVFLLGAGARFNRQRQQQTLQLDEELGLGLRFADYPARATLTSARHLVIRQGVAQRELEEELRLLYVAATRAQELLFVTGHTAPGVWDEYRAQYGDQDAPPRLISRMSVHNRLEWVLMAAAAETAGVQDITHAPEDVLVAEPGHAAQVAPSSTYEETAEDQAWVARGGALLAADVDRGLADLPARMSVSALKELARREPGDDQSYIMDRRSEPLPLPTFAAATAFHDGRESGTACHRFLELVDLTKLASVADVQTQLSELVSAGQFAAEQAALVPQEDVSWFAATPEGVLLSEHAGAVRREVPFVYAWPIADTGERAIIRGVIDCLLDTPDGLIVLDYKTDTVPDEHELAVRQNAYAAQLQVYALAARDIFDRPVTRAVLAFLRARRIVDVPLEVPSLFLLTGRQDLREPGDGETVSA